MPEVNDPRTNPPWFPREGILAAGSDLTAGQVEALKRESLARRTPKNKKPLRLALGFSAFLATFAARMEAITWFSVTEPDTGMTNAQTVDNIRNLMRAVVAAGGKIVFNLQGIGGRDVARPNSGQIEQATALGGTSGGLMTERELLMVRTDPILYSATEFYMPTADFSSYERVSVAPFAVPPTQAGQK